MLHSAELRWFWDEEPALVSAWFESGFGGAAAGGSGERTDVYLLDGALRQVGIKVRGGGAGVEVKGYLGLAAAMQVGGEVLRPELWCKWSVAAIRLEGLPTVAVTKARRLRTFRIYGEAVEEVPLGAEEQPLVGEAVFAAGCNLELTQVSVEGFETVWWTVGFEAFGEREAVAENLRRVVYKTVPAKWMLGLGARLMSYPEWLAGISVRGGPPIAPNAAR